MKMWTEQEGIYAMLSYLINVSIQIPLGFWILDGLLASSWNVAYRSLS